MEYIEREAALIAIKNLYPSVPFTKLLMEHWHKENKAYMECEMAIEKLHAADVRPVVKSHWVDNRVAFYRGCPKCGAFVSANLDEVFLRDFPSAVGKLNFCPNCGADMRNADD